MKKELEEEKALEKALAENTKITESMRQASLDKLKNMPGFGTRFFTALDVVKIMEAK